MKRAIFFCCAVFSASLAGASGFSYDETPGIPEGGGGATNLDVVSHGPGKATLAIKNANVNFLGDVPSELKVGMTADDKSGKGKAKIVSATGKYFEGSKWCWSGVGGNWTVLACAPLTNGSASVEIDFGGAPKVATTVALVPHVVLASGESLDAKNAWATHAENAQAIIPCPSAKTRDMITPITIQPDGTVRVATDPEVEAYALTYAKVCRR